MMRWIRRMPVWCAPAHRLNRPSRLRVAQIRHGQLMEVPLTFTKQIIAIWQFSLSVSETGGITLIPWNPQSRKLSHSSEQLSPLRSVPVLEQIRGLGLVLVAN